MKALFTRRSIRKYTSEKISTDQMDMLLKAGMYAPSAVNCQPWHFLVIESREQLLEITKIHPYAQMLKQAAAAILVLGDEDQEHAPGYWAVDCGAATENILLAAHGIGLGGVWIGIHPREERRKAFSALFQLPSHIQPFALISLGYPAESREAENRFVREKVHYNQW